MNCRVLGHFPARIEALKSEPGLPSFIIINREGTRSVHKSLVNYLLSMCDGIQVHGSCGNRKPAEDRGHKVDKNHIMSAHESVNHTGMHM